MLIMEISTQTGNHKYSKKVTNKKSALLDLKFWNPKFNILGKIAFIFCRKYQPCGVQRSKGHSRTIKSGEIGLWSYALVF